jgi:glycosyltransferase involved in cell wall biosynthesis
LTKISILLPTRNRPANLERFVRTAFATASRPQGLEILFGIDDDDHISLPKLLELQREFPIKYKVGPRRFLGVYSNELLEMANGTYLFPAGDDLVFETPGWDQRVRGEIDKYPDGIVTVYCRDGVNDERFACHLFFHKALANALGYITCPKFSARYLDTWIGEIFRNVANATNQARYIYLDDVSIQHYHYSVGGRAPFDQVYDEANKRDQEMAQVWYSSLAERIRDTKKLLAYINSVNDTDYKLTNYERIL